MNAPKQTKYAPGYGNDPLSEVMQLLKLNVDIYHNAKVCGNWRMDESGAHASVFHIVTLGSCFLDVPGHFSGRVEEGDLMIFSRALPHSLQTDVPGSGKQQHLSFKEGEQLTGTGLLCGDITFQHRGSQYLLDALPPLLIIYYEQAHTWLRPLLKMIVTENNQPGPVSKVIFDRLSELLVTYSVRHYLTTNPNRAGMLSLYAHERLALAINAIHDHPERAWTLDQLSSIAMMSRTVFAEKFKTVSSWTVGQYISWWRMQLAWDMLQRDEPVSIVADQVGFRSEAAFSRAFKKMFDVSPGRVRRESQPASECEHSN